jgi:hypothetical protein
MVGVKRRASPRELHRSLMIGTKQSKELSSLIQKSQNQNAPLARTPKVPSAEH